MPEYHPSDKVRAILAAAASSRDLLDMLIKNREQALARMGLSAEEKAAIMSLSAERLMKMVRRDQAGRGPWRALRSRALLFGGIVVALIVFKLMTSDGALRGDQDAAVVSLSKDDGAAKRAQAVLVRICIAEGRYRLDHGVYGSLEDLARSGAVKGEWVASELEGNEDYEFEIVLEGDSFTVVARHRTRPRTHPGFRVGPEGEIKAVE